MSINNKVIDTWTALAEELTGRFGTPGMSIGVAHKGETGYRHVGIRDIREWKAKPDDNTIYLLSSLTKPIMAAVIGMLVYKGKLRLEDPLSCFLDIKSHLKHRGGDELRIMDLINHHTEFYRCDRLWEGPDGHINLTNPDLIVALLQQLPSNPKFHDESSFKNNRNYCNLTYAMLAKAAEKTSQMPWHEMADSLFRDLGMSRSTTSIASRCFDGNIAGAHCAPTDGESFNKRDAFDNIQRSMPEHVAAIPVNRSKASDGPYIGAAAGACSTLPDTLTFFNKWATLYNNPGAADSEAAHGIEVIQAHLKDKISSKPGCAYAGGMNTVDLLGDGEQRAPGADGENYARMKQAMWEIGSPRVPTGVAAWPFFPLGKQNHEKQERRERRMFFHGGNMTGSTSFVTIIPDDQLTVVVLSNSRSYHCDLANLINLGLAHSLYYRLQGDELDDMLKQTRAIASTCKAMYGYRVWEYESKFQREYDSNYATPDPRYIGCYTSCGLILQILEGSGRLEFRPPGAAYELPLRVKKGSKGLIMTCALHAKQLHEHGLGGKNWIECNFKKTELSFSELSGGFFNRVTWQFEDMIEDSTQDFVREFVPLSQGQGQMVAQV